jgi:hypothetical protein
MKLGEAAFALGVSEITLRRKVKGGRLPFELRDGKYFVMLYRDAASGKYQEPTTSVLSPLPDLSSSAQGGGGFDSERIALLEQQLMELRSMIEERDTRIRDFQRTIEDQETLIYLLEQKDFARTSASSPSL